MPEGYRYKRALLKLSGEALAGDTGYGVSEEVLNSIAVQVAKIINDGVQLAIVVGGGNLFRGGNAKNMDRNQADNIGMLATVMNALHLQDAFEAHNVPTRVMSAIAMPEICETYIPRTSIYQMEKGRVVICAAGTGNSFFTTDTTASLRACQLKAEVLMKATKVDGIYDTAPMKNPNAKKFDELSYIDVLNRGINVMDSTATSMCMDNNMPILVFNMGVEGNIERALRGEPVGTVVR